MGNFLFATVAEYGVQISEISNATQPDTRGGTKHPDMHRVFAPQQIAIIC